ncbi:capsid and scaffold protein [Klebsiella phage vB_KshKPC-M]|nr:capsid and scaffold protein [Klebsiella phage vB_KshKPC-M]
MQRFDTVKMKARFDTAFWLILRSWRVSVRRRTRRQPGRASSSARVLRCLMLNRWSHTRASRSLKVIRWRTHRTQKAWWKALAPALGKRTGSAFLFRRGFTMVSRSSKPKSAERLSYPWATLRSISIAKVGAITQLANIISTKTYRKTSRRRKMIPSLIGFALMRCKRRFARITSRLFSVVVPGLRNKILIANKNSPMMTTQTTKELKQGSLKLTAEMLKWPITQALTLPNQTRKLHRQPVRQLASPQSVTRFRPKLMALKMKLPPALLKSKPTKTQNRKLSRWFLPLASSATAWMLRQRRLLTSKRKTVVICLTKKIRTSTLLLTLSPTLIRWLAIAPKSSAKKKMASKKTKAAYRNLTAPKSSIRRQNSAANNLRPSGRYQTK